MTTIVTHMVGRPGDRVMTFCAEKCNCTQVTSMTLDAIGHGEKRREYSWVHDYRWGKYKQNNPPPSIDAIRRAKASGTVCLKFVRDPVDRFSSIYKRYTKIGIRGAPSGLSVDGFLDWLSTKNLVRYMLGSYTHDEHITSQRFHNETDDLWTDIIHVETFQDPEVRKRIHTFYGLVVDPEWTSDHWIPEPVHLSDEQRARVLCIYHMDARYVLPIRKQEGETCDGQGASDHE
jgi:hypothetical protein